MSNTALQIFDNPQPRCPVALLLDTSSSMDGEPIKELRAGARQFAEEIHSDDFARFAVEMAIITFGGRAELALPFASSVEGVVQLPKLISDGYTPMGQAIRIGLDELQNQKRAYKHAGIPYYQPWMVLMTDGEPNDDCWEEQAARARELAAQRKLVFLGIGIGDEVDMPTLTSILPANRPPKRLAGLQFTSFFEWLSQSLGRVTQSSVGDAVHLPPTVGWEAI